MIDHVVVRVKDFKKSLRFYEAALQPLGYRVLKEFPGFVGLGIGDKVDTWIGQDDAVTRRVHLAFVSRDRRTVDAFHEKMPYFSGDPVESNQPILLILNEIRAIQT